MKEIHNLTVKYHNRVVGILAETKDGSLYSAKTLPSIRFTAKINYSIPEGTVLKS